MSKVKAILIHGNGGGKVSFHWFPWVKNELEKAWPSKKAAKPGEEDTVKTKHNHEPNFGKHVHDCDRCTKHGHGWYSYG